MVKLFFLGGRVKVVHVTKLTSLFPERESLSLFLQARILFPRSKRVYRVGFRAKKSLSVFFSVWSEIFWNMWDLAKNISKKSVFFNVVLLWWVTPLCFTNKKSEIHNQISTSKTFVDWTSTMTLDFRWSSTKTEPKKGPCV